MTEIFIYISFGLIVIYDIVAVVYQTKKGKGNKLGLVTITSVFRKWFKEKPLVPFMIGGIFIGHFGCYMWNNLLPGAISLWVFIGLSVAFLVWQIVESCRKVKSKLHLAMCKAWPLPMLCGILAGSFWK